MSLLKAFIFACSIAAVKANPLPNTPSRVVRRDDPPAPSDYPLDNGACAGEWKYLNFDPKNGSDKSHLGTLHNMVCSGELRAYLSWGLASAEKGRLIYKDFFDDDDETKAAVADVFLKLAGDDSPGSIIGDVVKDMVIDNLDFGEVAGTGSTCEGGDTFGYTEVDPLDKREKIHFCNPTWGKPEGFDASTCKDLGERPSEKIDSITRIAMHEMTHYSTVGPASKLAQQIVDQQNDDGETAYGINRAFGLMDPDQDDQPGKAEVNADNYAYMAQLARVSWACSGNDDGTFFPLDPEDYDD